MFEEVAKLPDFRNGERFWLDIPTGDMKADIWNEELILEPPKEEQVLFVPFKCFSATIAHDLAISHKEQAFSSTKTDLYKTMVKHLSDHQVFNKWLVIVLEKQIFEFETTLHLVAYEVKWLDLKNIRWLKNLPGFQFIWLYGGILYLV